MAAVTKGCDDECQTINPSVQYQGKARTQSPNAKNVAPELSTFGIIAKVNPTKVQWKGLPKGAAIVARIGRNIF